MAAGTIAAPNAAKAAGAGGIGFNKMFVMVPVMLAARKLDAEDPKIVHYLRVAYGSMQTICVLVVLYTYWKASSKIDGTKIVYVPAAATVRLLCCDVFAVVFLQYRYILYYTISTFLNELIRSALLTLSAIYFCSSFTPHDDDDIYNYNTNQNKTKYTTTTNY
jgi:ABC-type polysaccharide/polyol phosphate export permease